MESIKVVYEDQTEQLLPSEVDRLMKRGYSILRLLSNDPFLRAAMDQAGYTMKDHNEGWTLFLACSGYDAAPVEVPVNPARNASAEIAGFAGVMLMRAQGALEHKHAEEEKFVFRGMDLRAGASPIANVTLFLDRLDELESGDNRASTREADHHALFTLERRGITTEVREELRALLVMACSSEFANDTTSEKAEARKKSLKALRLWLTDWTNTARTVFKRRDQLIRLGIGKQRRGRKAPPQQAVAEPVIAGPVTQPPAPIEPALNGPASLRGVVSANDSAEAVPPSQVA